MKFNNIYVENYHIIRPVCEKERRKNTINNTPKSKTFNISKFKKELADLAKNMDDDLKIQQTAALLVPNILEKFEGFKTVKKGQEDKDGTCEFFGSKNGTRYIIEAKGFLKRFNMPDAKQKGKLQGILNENKNLEIVLLQVKINKSQYRIFYKKDMEFHFQV